LWNQASEDQAFDRCYRLGQTKDVYVTRYRMQYNAEGLQSIEKPIHDLQDGKGMLGQGCMKKLTSEERQISRQTDVKLLFDLN